jgi:hypothetical protein
MERANSTGNLFQVLGPLLRFQATAIPATGFKSLFISFQTVRPMISFRSFLFLFFFGLLSLSAQAQGNLQFNRVINLDLTGPPVSGSSPYNYVSVAAQTVTVPVGKVWKVESVDVGITKGYVTSSENSLHTGAWCDPVLYLNNVMIKGNTATSSRHKEHMVRWLAEGNHVFDLYFERYNGVAPFTVSAFITIIEFNVVP